MEGTANAGFPSSVRHRQSERKRASGQTHLRSPRTVGGKQHLDNLRRKDALRGAATTEISVRLGKLFRLATIEGSAGTRGHCLYLLYLLF